MASHYDVYIANFFGLSFLEEVRDLVRLLKEKSLIVCTNREEEYGLYSRPLNTALINSNIEKSEVFLVPITHAQFADLSEGGLAYEELESIKRRGNGNVIPIVLTDSLLDSSKWGDDFLSALLYFDFTSNQRIADNIDRLVAKIKGNSNKELPQFTKEYFSKLFEEGISVKYNRMKIMFCGRGRAGKSSTIRCLTGKEFVEDLPSTVVADSENDAEVFVKDLEFWTWKERNFEQKNHMLSKELREIAARLNDSSDLMEEKKEETFKPEIAQKMGENMAERMRTKSEEGVEKFEERDFEVTGVKYENVGDSVAKLSVWDFGGQKVFDSLHPIYLTDAGIYFLIFSVKGMLTSPEEEISYLKEWLQSINLHASRSSVVIIGTHRFFARGESNSKEEGQKNLKEVDARLKTILKETKATRYFLNKKEKLCFFPIENSINAANEVYLKPIKEVILKAFLEEKESEVTSLWSKSIPLAWMVFMDELFNEEIQKMSVKDVKKRAEIYSFSEESVEKMLNFYAEVGAIIKFDKFFETDERNFVVLRPQWLLKAFSAFVYDPDWHSERFISLRQDDDLREKLEKFEESGILSDSFLLKLFSLVGITKQTDIEFVKVIAENLFLLSKFPFDAKEEQSEGGSWWVPAMSGDVLKPEDVEEEMETDQPGHNIILQLSPFLPNGVFEKIVCVGLTSLLQREEASEPQTLRKNIVTLESSGIDIYFTPLKEEKAVKVRVVEENGKELPLLLKTCHEIEGVFSLEGVGQKLKMKVMLEAEKGGEVRRVDVEELSEALKKKKKKVNNFRVFGEKAPRCKIDVFKKYFPALVPNIEVENKMEIAIQESRKNPTAEWEFDVFLAHAWANNGHERVKKVGQQLRERGVRVWLDEEQLESTIVDGYRFGLQQCAAVLVFITKEYMEKSNQQGQNCYMEFITAFRQRKKHFYSLIPVVLDKEFLDPSIWAYFNVGVHFPDTNYVNLAPGCDIEKSLKDLVERIESVTRKIKRNDIAAPSFST